MSEPCAPSSSDTFDPASLPPPESSPVTVMFSGGSDSSLTASLLSERHTHVHLLTYRHAAMRFEDKCLHALERLKKAHGADRFTHRFFDLNPLMKQLYVKPIVSDLRKWGTYALPMCCGSCKLAMHIRTILYNRANGIPYAADGSNVELSELFPEQMPGVLEQYRQLYARYGVHYSNPVFYVNRSDHRLYERGVTEKRDYKTEHVVYSNQHSCAAGVMLYGYTMGVGLPLLARSADRELAERYIKAKIEEQCVPFLEREVKNAVLWAA